jgi:DNA polymerase (family 10)
LNNREVAQVFDTIADLLEIKGEAIYRVLAYRRAAESLRTLGRDVNAFWQEGSLRSIAGVGEAIASKIDELLSTGHIAFYDKLTSEMPAGLVDVLQVGDVGPKKARRFWKELNITSIESLEQAARQGELAQLSGMGAKSEARILENIEALKRRQTGRFSIGVALPTAEALLGELRALDSVERAEAAGSVRRMRETVGDLDLLVASSDGPAVMEAFVHFPQIARVLGRGDTKSSVELHDGLRVQVWVHPSEHFGTALQYATGSQAHNVRLRELALDQGLSLSEHGFKTRQGKELFCSTEEQVYATLGLPWIPPELREDRGEIKAAQEDRLPDLIEESDLRGELHAHTDWSDGSVSLEIMAQAAVEFGLDYLVISDHTQSLGVANGLSPERLEAQRKEIDKLQRKLGDRLVLLHGAEVEILADGRLDLPEEVLSRLDIVVASLHTSLRQPRPQVTARLLGAIASRNVDVIGHPSGRLIGSRDPADLDMEAVLQAASEHDTALEINANPERLDLNDGYARRAAGLGCLLTIDTDAHRPEHLSLRRYGVGTARRAWLPAEAVLNTWPLDRLRDWLNSRK